MTAGTVWVVDAKKYSGRPELRVEGGILRPRVEKLIVGRRDQTKLVDGVLGQIDKLQARIPAATIRGALCFVDADWPLIGGSFTARGVAVLWPRKLAELIQKHSSGQGDVDAITRTVERTFPPA